MASIDVNDCVGCGICANICPDGIEMSGGKAQIKDSSADCLKQAANSCPRQVIHPDGEQDGDAPPVQPRGGMGGDSGQGMGRGMGGGRGMGRGRGQGMGKGRGRRGW